MLTLHSNRHKKQTQPDRAVAEDNGGKYSLERQARNSQPLPLGFHGSTVLSCSAVNMIYPRPDCTQLQDTDKDLHAAQRKTCTLQRGAAGGEVLFWFPLFHLVAVK